MSTIIPFDFEQHAVRVLTREGEPWFVLADVCGVLSISNSRDASSRLDDDEKGVVITDTLGGPQEMNIINESGLYTLILTSRKPEAKRFRKWVTAEVLPAIRKTGSFGLPSSAQEWFNIFARTLCLWDALGQQAAQQEWLKTGLTFPLPHKQAVRLLMEATLNLPAQIQATSQTRKISNRHNGALGGRPRNGETPAQARLRRFHMVDKEITPSPDGSSAVVVTYATHEGA
ncbi:Bro-N domain-containing protein [Acetobacter orientalis]|uniref:BRO-N domain-containing protein n=1 Tax=Acetobacter orientalis TaxID=146474 RepID=UPI0039E85883